MMTTKIATAAMRCALAAALSLPATAALADKSTPDWPCVQRKVENLTVSQFWDGPPTEGLKGWWQDKELNAQIELLAARRVPLEEAEKSLKAYAASLPAETRDEKLTLLFAGLFEKINIQRRGVISGLEKYLQGQRVSAAEIEKQGADIAALEAKVAADPSDQQAAAELQALLEKFEWASRIFQERQNNIPVACELPVIIDQRLYEAARLIRSEMSS